GRGTEQRRPSAPNLDVSSASTPSGITQSCQISLETNSAGQSPAAALLGNNMSSTPTKIYRMRLRSIGSDHNEIHRLKALLKVMLRRFHFRVMGIELEHEKAAETHQSG